MADETTYSISELAAVAGVTVRTIRYYAAEGLLPAPEQRGKYAVYRNAHLERLRLIAQLKAAYLPLSAIKEQLDQLGSARLSEVSMPPQRLAETSGSAAEYISNALAGRLPVPQAPGQSGPSAPAALLAEEAPRAEHMLGPLSEAAQIVQPKAAALLPGRAELQPPAAPGAPAPVPPAAVQPPAPDPAPPRTGSLLDRLVPRRKRAVPGADQTVAPTATPPTEERWSRVLLVPGVELHIREPAPPALRERLARLIEQARHLLNQ